MSHVSNTVQQGETITADSRRELPTSLPVLVLDSQAQNSLGFTRSLGRRGVPVVAGGRLPYLPGMLSKYSVGRYVHPAAAADPHVFVDDLIEHLEENEYAHVYALSDLTTAVLSRNKERIEATGTRVGVEDWETFRAANDKKQLFERMASVDVPTPDTHAPDTIGEVERIDERREGAVVIKPRTTTTMLESTGESQTNRMDESNYVLPDDDLVARYRELIRGNDAFQERPPLIQEYVDGPETMCTVGLADEGELLTTFQHEKFRVYPLSGGVGAVRRGIDEPLMRRYAERVVSALGWTGPVHVEFMKTYDDDFVLLEVNGRYWGSLALTINSGVDIPWFHYQLLEGEEPERLPSRYRTDVKQRRLFFHDFLWLRENLRRGNVSALGPFLASFLTTREEFLDPNDPLPTLGVLVRLSDVISNKLRGKSTYPRH